jgi:hypothetical protein
MFAEVISCNKKAVILATYFKDRNMGIAYEP